MKDYTNTRKKVVVIGSGIIGIMTAYYLINAGFDVVILEKESSFGSGTSFANGGQISFSHIAPITLRTNLFQKLQIITNASKHDILPKWIKENENFSSHYDEAFQILKDMSCSALDEYNKIILSSDSEISSIFKESGILHLFQTEDEMEKFKSLMQSVYFGKNSSKVMAYNDLIELEPALSIAQINIKCGMYFANDKLTNCYDLCGKLLKIIIGKGCNILYNVEVDKFNIVNNKIQHVTDKNDNQYDADHFVLCTGCETNNLIKDISLNLPIYPIRGYSAMINVDYSNYIPMIGLIDSKNQMVYAQHRNYLRIAGFFDFGTMVNTEKQINNRIDDLLEKAYQMIPILKRHKIIHRWSGLRPMTPNMVPIVKRSESINNLFVNTGHGTLGVTLAPDSAKRILSIIQEE